MCRARLAMLVALALACACSSGDDDSQGDGKSKPDKMNDPFGNGSGGSGSGSSGSGGASFGNSGGGGTTTGSGMNGGSGNGASGSGAPGGGAGDCASAMAYASRIVPTIHLVVDGSCSMELDLTSQEPYGNCEIEEPGAATRWGALRQALVGDPDGVVTRLQDVISFGFALFGTQPMCPLVATPLAPAVGQGDAIRAAFPIKPPGTNTPTGLALQQIVDGLQPNTGPDTMIEPQIIVLATDGAPNSCDDSTIDFQPSLDAAMAAQAKGVTMYVLSLAEPSGEYGMHLQQMADIGLNRKDAPLYAPSSQEQLRTDLESLIGGAVGCDVRVNGKVDAKRACEGEVRINGELIACGTDWELMGESTLHLLGETCDRFKTDASAMLTARWPCGAFRVD
jgi:hypothetical protein